MDSSNSSLIASFADFLQSFPNDMQEMLSRFIEAVKKCDIILAKQIYAEQQRSQTQSELINVFYESWTSVHYAIQAGDERMLMWLISEGGDTQLQTKDGWDSLTIAVNNQHHTIVQMLLPSCDPNFISVKGTALHIAAEIDDAVMVKILLQHPQIRTMRFEGKTPQDLAGKKSSILLESPLEVFRSSMTNVLNLANLSRNSLLVNMPQRPAIIQGKVLKVNYFKIIQYQRTLVIDPESGYLARYKENVDLLNPCELIPLENIYKVKICGLNWFARRNYHYIKVKYQNKQFFFGVQHIQTADKWVDLLHKAIGYVKYCRDKLKNYIEQSESTKIQQVIVSELLQDQIIINVNDESIMDHQKYIQNKQEEVKKQHRCRLESISERSIYENDLSYLNNVGIRDFQIQECIGKGSFGLVFKVLYNSQVYALKQQDKAALIRSNNLKYALSEVNVFTTTYHPFLVNCILAFQTEQYLYLLLEYCEQGDLSQYITRGVIWPEYQSKFYIAEIILAIEYLHSKNIIYRDLKPENIAIDSLGHIRLIDFGLSKAGQTIDILAMSFCGSPAYLSPEVIHGIGATRATDIYGIGALLYEMLTGYPPHYCTNLEKLFNDIRYKHVDLPKSISPGARDLLLKVLDKQPHRRPTTKALKAHPFFSDINWTKLELKQYKAFTLEMRFSGKKKLKDEQLVDIDYEDTQLNNFIPNWNFSR